VCVLSSSGITVIVPLVDLSLELGPTEILLGSQHLTQSRLLLSDQSSAMSRWRRALSTVTSMHPLVPFGSALFFDSRCLHRGLANTTPASPRPVLIFRYDRNVSPPPGHSVASTLLMRCLGRCLSAWADLHQDSHQS
jgi:ectoine hydroxylase-related dioxygenase (phytanoyl-CoA dioxygenase family)